MTLRNLNHGNTLLVKSSISKCPGRVSLGVLHMPEGQSSSAATIEPGACDIKDRVPGVSKFDHKVEMGAVLKLVWAGQPTPRIQVNELAIRKFQGQGSAMDFVRSWPSPVDSL
jgi:hypothetical protein